MRLCLLVDSIGVAPEVQDAAINTWGARAGSVVASWLVRDSGVANPSDHPGFTLVDGKNLWVHQPVLPYEYEDESTASGHKFSFSDLNSKWPPPSDWAGERNIESLIWHVQRRWRLLTSPAVLKLLRAGREGNKTTGRSCDWVGLFRANSYVNIEAIAAVLENDGLLSPAKGDKPLIIGRGMTAETHGKATPVINWGGEDLFAISGSSGLLLNQAAVELLAQGAGHDRLGTLDALYIEKIVRWLLSFFSALSEALAGTGELDGAHVSCFEIVFAACMRSQSRQLLVTWLARQKERFLTGDLLLRRFLFRLGSSTFEWSRVETGNTGLGFAGRGSRRGHQGLPPQCALSLYPVNTRSAMETLHRTLSRVACVPAANLALDAMGNGGVRIVARGMGRHLQIGASGRELYARRAGLGQGAVYYRKASLSPAYNAILRRNRRIWSAFVAGPRQKSEEALGKGNADGKFRFSPALGRSLGLDAISPEYFHDHEWIRGQAGQLRLNTPVTIVASLPNSGTTWFQFVLQIAQQTHVGVAAIMSDVLHPFCNPLLSTELSKIMGAPEDSSWRHIFQRTPSGVAADLMMEMAADSMHNKAIYELQYMRQHGTSVVGEVLPAHLVWPWKDQVDPESDATRIKLLLSKEVINVFSLVQYMVDSHTNGVEPTVSFIGLYRHRAHTFPMSNQSANLCKECMLHKIVHSFEVNTFPHDPQLAGLQRWWKRRAPHVGGIVSSCGIVFAHLLIWYTVLRAASSPAGVKVVDYARLMTLNRPELRDYLRTNLPNSLLESPGVFAIASSIDANRFKEPLDFLEKRARMYSQLGVEGFARNAIAQMHRLDPLTDLSLLEQSPQEYLVQ